MNKQNSDMGTDTLEEMAREMSKVDDIAWGMYAFSRDALRDKADDAHKREMIKRAIGCGCEKAEEIADRTGSHNPWEIADILGLKVEYLESGQMAGRVLFALFTPPRLIQIMREPIRRAGENKSLTSFLSEKQIADLILGHEIFHYLEEEDGQIYTRKHNIRLWKMLWFEKWSAVGALSEIGAMYFSRKLTGFPCSPFILDILLYYYFDSEGARNMYREVVLGGREGCNRRGN